MAITHFIGRIRDLNNDLVAEAGVNEVADEVFGVKGGGEAEVDGAGVVEGFEVIGGESELGAGEVVLELGEFAGADNGNNGDGTVAEPGESDLGHAASGLSGDGFDGGDDAGGAFGFGHEAFHHVAAHAAGFGGFIVVVIFTGKDAVGKGRPGGDGEVEGLGGGEEFAFDGALNEAVFDLESGEVGPAAKGGDGVGLSDPPGGGVGDADV